MKVQRRKPHSGRREQAEDVRHWLGEGYAGQEALFLDLDPILYAVDRALSHRINQFVYARTTARHRPIALIIPPESTVAWQLGFLAERFETNIWAAGEDPILVEAANHFDSLLFDGEIPETLTGKLDLVVCTDYAHQDRAEWLISIREALDALQTDGELIAVVQTENSANGRSFIWQSGVTSPLDDLIERNTILGIPSPTSVEHISLLGFSPSDSDYLSDFLKRHREFFGRNTRDICLQRMGDPDFFSPFHIGGSADGLTAASLSVSLISWRA